MEESPSAVAGQPALSLKDEVVQVGRAGCGAVCGRGLPRLVVVHAGSSLLRIYISVYAGRGRICAHPWGVSGEKIA